MNALFISFKVYDYDSLAIYEYNEFIKRLIYLFKGCYDYELFNTFISHFAKQLNIMYHSYVVVPIPSFSHDNETRGYNHVIEIFKCLNLTVLDLLEKIDPHKQAKSRGKNREDISKYLKIKKPMDLNKKKILIVDDIYTTGSTIKTAINLIEKLNPLKIKILVMAKTANHGKSKR